MRIKMLKCLITVLVGLSSYLAPAQNMVNFNWLEGIWTIRAEKYTIQERWYRLNDSTYQGQSVLIKPSGDTIPQESLTISYTGGDWYYISKVIGQNNNQPVRFKIFYHKNFEFISENPLHDFPQRIQYRKINQQLLASIEGKKNGKYGKQNFDFMRQEVTPEKQ